MATDRPELRPVADAAQAVIERTFASPSLRSVLDAISRTGGLPLVVGGAVRDALLGRSPKDIDIEVHRIGSQQLIDILTSAGTVLEVGASFSVLKLVIEDGSHIDFSLPRRDTRTGPGHRDFTVEIDPHMGYEAAAARRDFTINSLALDLDNGELLDPHRGLDDLRAGILRHTSAAFAEDPLRVLRGAQFAGRFDLDMHPTTVELSASIADEFESLPVERIWTEFDKIFRSAPTPSRALKVLIDTGWIRHFPELQAIVGVPQDAAWHPEGTVDIHSGLAANAAAALCERRELASDDRAFVVCAALLHDLGKATHTQIHADGRITAYGHAEAGTAPTNAFLRRIGAPDALIARVVPVVREHMCCVTSSAPTPTAVRRLARRLAPATILDWSYVVEADNRGRAEGSREGCAGPWLELAQLHEVDTQTVQSLVRGQDLIDAGLTPGPHFRTILANALHAQEEGVFADRESALDWLREVLNEADEHP